MAMIKVASSNLDEIGYDARTERLYVRFNSGELYRYDAVPQSVWAAFAQAPSKGIFLNKEVKSIFKSFHMEKDDEPTFSDPGSSAEPVGLPVKYWGGVFDMILPQCRRVAIF